jgi:hypothetical protein
MVGSWLRRRWWVLALVAGGLLLIAAIGAFDRPTRIEYYRVTAPTSIVIGVTSGRATWTRIVEVAETASAVTITVKSVEVPLPQTPLGVGLELAVALHDPLGDRSIVDGTDGNVAVQTRCIPPLYFAPGCVVEANPS